MTVAWLHVLVCLKGRRVKLFSAQVQQDWATCDVTAKFAYRPILNINTSDVNVSPTVGLFLRPVSPEGFSAHEMLSAPAPPPSSSSSPLLAAFVAFSPRSGPRWLADTPGQREESWNALEVFNKKKHVSPLPLTRCSNCLRTFLRQPSNRVPDENRGPPMAKQNRKQRILDSDPWKEFCPPLSWSPVNGSPWLPRGCISSGAYVTLSSPLQEERRAWMWTSPRITHSLLTLEEEELLELWEAFCISSQSARPRARGPPAGGTLKRSLSSKLLLSPPDTRHLLYQSVDLQPAAFVSSTLKFLGGKWGNRAVWLPE